MLKQQVNKYRTVLGNYAQN